MAADPEPQVLTVSADINIEGGAYAEQSLLIVSYIGEEGEHKFAWQQAGGGSVATMIGLMEMIKLAMIAGSTVGD